MRFSTKMGLNSVAWISRYRSGFVGSKFSLWSGGDFRGKISSKSNNVRQEENNGYGGECRQKKSQRLHKRLKGI